MATAEAPAMAVMSLPFVVQGGHAMIGTYSTGPFARSPSFLTNN